MSASPSPSPASSAALAAPIPVTVLTGFLGAGKTTLLNRILSEQHGKKIAVIENEFGEVGVDNQLVIQSDEELFEMNNGCICCTVRGDLIRILGRLMKRKDRLDGILIETTGLADPGPVAQTFFTDEDMRAAFRLDGIVTVVDAKHIWQHIDDTEEAQKQVAFADVIILNKTDLVPPAELDKLEARIRQMNAAARIHRTQNASIDLAHVLNVGGFNLSRATDLNPQFLEPEYPFAWAGAYALPAGTHTLEIGHPPGEVCDHEHHHTHDCGEDHHHETPAEMDVVILPVKSLAESDLAAARDAAVHVFSDWENKVAPSEPVTPGATLHRLQLVEGHARFPLPIAAPGLHVAFEQNGELALHIEVMGETVKPAWQRDFQPPHTHDDAVTSVGITHTGDIDGKKLNDWIGELLKTKGNDIYRCKGVLAVKGSPNRLVFQGVHMLFDAKFDRPWADSPRENTLVFIGKNLDRAALTAAFKSCLA